MKRLLVLAAVVVFAGLAIPALSAAGPSGPGPAPASGLIAGSILNSANQPLGNVTVQLFDVNTGQLIATSKVNAAGLFSFNGLASGSYVVSVLDAAGGVSAVSTLQNLSQGSMTSRGVTISAAGNGFSAWEDFFKNQSHLFDEPPGWWGKDWPWWNGNGWGHYKKKHSPCR